MTIFIDSSIIRFQVRYIKFAECLDFSPDGNHMAVAEKSSSSSDPNSVSIAIYDCSDWEEVNRMATRCSEVAGVAWEPTKGGRLAVWNGALESVFQIFTSGGTLIMDHSDETSGMGVRTLRWSPCGQLLLVAMHGERRLRIFNAVNCTYFSALEHGDVVSGDDMVTSECAVFEETDVPAEDIDGKIIQEWLNTRDAVYESVTSRPYRLAHTQIVATSKKRTSSSSSSSSSICGPGISEILFSPSGRHVATLDESCPAVVWVWDLQELRLCAALSHSHPVTGLSWEPGVGKTRLAMLTGGSPTPKVFLWSLLGAVVLRIPVAASSAGGEGDVVVPSKIRWNPQGHGAMCLVGKDGFVCSKIAKKTTLKGLAAIEASRSDLPHELP